MTHQRSSLASRCQEGTPAVFNRRKLHAFTLGDPTLEREILELFLAQIGEIRDQLRSAGDATVWHRAAHTLRGSAATIGAEALAELAAEAVGLSPRDADGSVFWSVQVAHARDAARHRFLDLLDAAISQFRAGVAVAKVAEPA